MKNLTIERSRGATYSHPNRFAVYEHSVYPRHSVLAGQSCRRFVDDFDSIAAAQAAHPTARVISGTTYAPPDLSHLPEEDY
jgi:hypothetical protein